MDSIWSSKNILEARNLSKMTAVAAAGLLNITPEYLSMLENGSRRPSEKVIAKMAVLYRQPIGFFLKSEKNLALA